MCGGPDVGAAGTTCGRSLPTHGPVQVSAALEVGIGRPRSPTDTDEIEEVAGEFFARRIGHRGAGGTQLPPRRRRTHARRDVGGEQRRLAAIKADAASASRLRTGRGGSAHAVRRRPDGTCGQNDYDFERGCSTSSVTTGRRDGGPA